MIKIGVTGSNGFIGWHLCRTLELYSGKFELIEFKREWFNEDINLDLFVSKCNIIVHLAGINRHCEESAIYETNVSLAERLVKSFKRTEFKGQVIFSSSKQEERSNIFGNSKKMARELFANWANLSTGKFQGLIIPNVFGAFCVPFYNSVVSTFCHQLINNEVPKIETDATLNLIYINDLIKKIINIFDSDTNSKITIEHTDTKKVSEILNTLLNFKTKYLENGQIPDLKNQFEINLFNTFRSYLNLKIQFPIKYKNNIDVKGNFVEIIRLESGGQVSFSTTSKGITRGNHFHTRKIERFSVIKGKALIQLRKIGTSEIFDYFLYGEEPAYVDIPIWYTHNIKNIGEEELYTIFWINEFYDSNDSDTFFENV
ncbi:polysaccharide biosynthesis C-terminal domain-containing protein [Aquirufa rosea]|uniref:SDR family oxidoreductase n=1 Tax=Aquirufa rosea TaxID=2509241 RepID=A0A4Q1BYW1_9BACT|nr:NAD-dependent epimerase/dehydratase family protein [Aquirufa rosea]RXK48269.1 SDR family oxidoreductase [Aquirufa rosea]